MNKESFYFSHDYNARHDPKLISLCMSCGMEGLGIYWCIIEMLYEQNGYISIYDVNGIAFELHTDCERIKDVIENHNLFEFENDKFYSNSVLNRLKVRDEKSGLARESALKRWYPEKYKDANALQSQSEGNAIKERKGKDIIEKNKYADFVSMTEDEFNKLKTIHGKENTNTFVKILNNYKGSTGKKYKSDYLTILNWVIDKAKKENKYIVIPQFNLGGDGNR